jgi:hypothetical protein
MNPLHQKQTGFKACLPLAQGTRLFNKRVGQTGDDTCHELILSENNFSQTVHAIRKFGRKAAYGATTVNEATIPAI